MTANSGGYPSGSFNLWGSIVTIRDDTKPKLTAGGLWADGWHQAAEALTYESADTAGVRSIRAEVGGVTTAANSSCDTHRPAPCPVKLSGTLALGSRPADGAQPAQVAATDAAGNETLLTRTVLVDGTAPAVALRPPRRRNIVVRVSDQASGFAAGQILVRQSSAEQYRPLPTTLQGRWLRAPLDRGRPARTDVRIIVRDNAGNEANGVPAPHYPH